MVALVLLVPLFTIQGPGSWQTVWWFGLPGLVGIVGTVLGGIGRHRSLVVANLVCGVLSVPLLLIIATLALGP